MSETTLLDNQNFREFYATAKRSTYAAGGDQKAEILEDGGKRYVFWDKKRWPQWRYIDTYYGYNPFFGNEIVEEVPLIPPVVWTPIAQMSYGGYARGTEKEVKRMFVFLEEMLQLVSAESLFRGPIFSTIRRDNMEYGCSTDRDSPFQLSGRESIHLFDKEKITAYHELKFLFSCVR